MRALPRRFVVAHRGDRSRAPDNSLAALELAVKAGADMVEVDVRRTADGVCVLCHDDIVSRLSAGACGPDIPRLAAEARAKGFADANVREMQVVLVHP